MRVNAARHRQQSFGYYVTLECHRVRICKKAFAALHQITNSKIDHVLKQLAAGLSAPRPVQRGKHNNRPQRVNESKVKQVKQHIMLFPAESSHYSRESNPNRMYLSPDLNINRLYGLYKIWCCENRYEPVSSRSYRDIFNTQFNLGFGSPKSDTCTVCDIGVNAEHKAAAEHAFVIQKQDRELAKTNDNTYYITFDLQKTLPLPRLTTSIAFYLRQIWLYNLGIHFESKAISKLCFQIWTEADGGRGCSEVASCILAWTDILNISGGNLVCWSDSCAGQNKNFFIICLWQYLVKTKKFDKIDHKFPVSGHSYMDSDRDFSHIEKMVREKNNIYSVDEYQDIMARSQTRSKPIVTRMAGKLYDVKDLPKHLNLVNRTQNTAGEQIKFRDKVRWIQVDQFGEYRYKHSLHDDEEWKTVNILQSEIEVPDFDLRQKCTHGHGKVKKAKLIDIEKQLPYIPLVYREFYNNLETNFAPSSHDDVEPSDDEDSIHCDNVEPVNATVIQNQHASTAAHGMTVGDPANMPVRMKRPRKVSAEAKVSGELVAATSSGAKRCKKTPVGSTETGELVAATSSGAKRCKKTPAGSTETGELVAATSSGTKRCKKTLAGSTETGELVAATSSGTKGCKKTPAGSTEIGKLVAASSSGTKRCKKMPIGSPAECEFNNLNHILG